MSWFKENKFLAGLLIVTLVGAAVLGFLMISAKAAFAEAQERYDTQAAELGRLQNSAPYPDEENLKKMEGLRTNHFTAITTLQKDLAAAEIPLKPMTPEQFKDALDNSVKRIIARAGEAGVKLPLEGKFYMGFDRYERDVPKPEAAAPLGRQLAAMELAMMMLLENRIAEIADLKREPLPEEGLPATNVSNARPEPEPAKGKQGKSDNAKELVTRNSFDVGFIAYEAKAHSFINSLITSKQQFFVPRSVSVRNERLEGPPRVDPNASQPSVTPPPPPRGTSDAPTGTAPDPGIAPATPPAPPAPTVPAAISKYVVGDERVQIAMRVDVVHFSEPTATNAAK